MNQFVGKSLGVDTPQYLAPNPSAYQYPLSPPTYSHSGYASASAYTPAPAYATTSAYAYAYNSAQMQQSVPQPVYSTSTSGLTVDISHGGMLTQARGVFISNINYKASKNDVRQLICATGARPLEITPHKDPKSGSFKGTATAKFSTKEEAQLVVRGLDGRQHMGLTLRARGDLDTTVVGSLQAPLIVNGSVSGVS